MENIFETLANATKPQTMSTTVKHTPGPWFVEENSNWNQIGKALIIRAENPSKNLWDQVATVGRDGELITGLMGGSAQANAKLIAAAPELLEALVNEYEYLKHLCDLNTKHSGIEYNPERLKSLSSIIKKAL